MPSLSADLGALCAWPRCRTRFRSYRFAVDGKRYCVEHGPIALAQELPPFRPPTRLQRDGMRLLCALCGKPIPRSQDVCVLGEGWLRMVPGLEGRGRLAHERCAVNRWAWGETTPEGDYRDHWDAIEATGSAAYMAVVYPGDFAGQASDGQGICPKCNRPLWSAHRDEMTDGAERHESCLRPGRAGQ